MERARRLFQSAGPGHGEKVAQMVVVELGIDREILTDYSNIRNTKTDKRVSNVA